MATTAALSLQQVGHLLGQPLSVLQDIALDIAPGEHIALFGYTGGCGKLTLLQLLTRAWDNNMGSITLNNLPLNQWIESALLRDMISVVPHSTFIFLARHCAIIYCWMPPQASDAQLSQQLEYVGLGHLLETP
ncbi:MAG: ATP-binding cassette domain-containing protein [Candidatus Malihini olakiniferum]